jgi:hypothetical protein
MLNQASIILVLKLFPILSINPLQLMHDNHVDNPHSLWSPDPPPGPPMKPSSSQLHGAPESQCSPTMTSQTAVTEANLALDGTVLSTNIFKGVDLFNMVGKRGPNK